MDILDVNSLMSQIQNSVDKELKACANNLLDKSKELAPKGADEVRKKTGVIAHKGGTLEESGRVEERNESANVRCVSVIYDTREKEGSDFNYAIIQHERPFSHEKGQWKYLETPYKENKNKYAERISNALEGKGSVGLDGGFLEDSKETHFD